jgi:hypothetical protein
MCQSCFAKVATGESVEEIDIKKARPEARPLYALPPVTAGYTP